MASVGFQGAFAQDAMAQQVRQRILDQLSQAKDAHTMGLQDAELKMKQDEFAQQTADRAAALKERGLLTAAKIGDETATNLGPGQTVLDPNSIAAKNIMASPQAVNMRTDQTLPSTQIAAGMAAPNVSPELSARFSGTLSPLIQPPPEAPSAAAPSTAPTVTDQAPKLTGQLRFMGTPAQNDIQNQRVLNVQTAGDKSAPAGVRGFLRANPDAKGVPYELYKDAPTKSITDSNYSLNGKPIVGLKNPEGRIMYQGQDVTDRVTPYAAPSTTDSDESVQQGPGGFVVVNKRLGTSRPVAAPAGGGQLGLKPSAQMQTHEVAKSEANDTLNQLDQSVENAKDLIGPGEGRVSSFEQMVGNADPRIQDLQAKMLAAKAKISAALTPSVRSSMNPATLGQFENLLSSKVTPEGLHAVTKAFREIIGVSGASNNGETPEQRTARIRKAAGL